MPRNVLDKIRTTLTKACRSARKRELQISPSWPSPPGPGRRIHASLLLGVPQLTESIADTLILMHLLVKLMPAKNFLEINLVMMISQMKVFVLHPFMQSMPAGFPHHIHIMFWSTPVTVNSPLLHLQYPFFFPSYFPLVFLFHYTSKEALALLPINWSHFTCFQL